MSGYFSPTTNAFVTAGKSGAMIAASAARTTAYTGEAIENPGAVGLRVDVDISSINSVTPSVTFKIQKYNRAAGTWADVLASVAKTEVGAFSLTVSPAIDAAANEVAQEEAPGTWRLVTTVGDADAMTWAASFEYLLQQAAVVA